MELDHFDRRLLNLVQEDAAQTTERIAEQIGLSPSAVQRRLRRLRELHQLSEESCVLLVITEGPPPSTATILGTS